MDRHSIPKELCKDRTLTPQLRRQDKSTAVGRGACGWLYWIFLSPPAHAPLPLDVKILGKSTVTAPSYLPKPADGRREGVAVNP
jgi:hypothetical protein